MINDTHTKLNAAVNFLQDKLSGFQPEIGLILGSGLGALGDEVENPIVVPYEQIPNFPQSTVEGHAGQLVMGTLKGKKVLVMQGRFHYYEGYSIQDVTLPVKVMKKLGVDKLIVTNAAGGINRNFHPGDLMLITDHINLTGNNPLLGPNDNELGPRFPDMSEAYNKSLRQVALTVAKEQNLNLQQGVYVGLTGPTYETPAEIRYLGIIGGDAVGMSTVPEVIVANYLGMQVLGISCISNMAAGILDRKLDHSEVMETAEKVKTHFLQLVKGIVEKL